MSGGIVAKNDLANHALIFGEMSFFDETIGSVIFILSEETKLFLRTQDFGAGEAAVFIEIIANFFAELVILASGSGGGFVICRIGFVNGARAIGIEHDTDADLAVVFLGGGAKGGGEAEEKSEGDAAHDVKQSSGGN